MIEQGLFKSHFVGRDGFVWWIGQIAPKETWQKNFGNDGKLVEDTSQATGIGTRYRVRIMGYHTASKDEIPDNELPFAMVMFPVTAGSGNAVSSQSSNIRQGDFVFGFFLDGEDAQQPVIMGVIGYNDYAKVMEGVPSIGFKPFYGLDGPKPALGRTNQQSSKVVQYSTNGEVDAVSTEVAAVSDAAVNNVVDPDSSNFKVTIAGKNQVLEVASSQPSAILSTDRNEMPLAGIQRELQKAIIQIETLKKSIREIGDEQSARLGNIKNLINEKIDQAAEMVASAIKWVYEIIEEHVFNKLDDGFKAIYAAARPNEREKVKTTTGKIMDNMACFFRALFAKLLGMVRNFIVEAVDKIVNVPICFVEKFVGNTLGAISGVIEGAMESVQTAIDGVVDFAVEGLDLAGDVMNLVSRILSTLHCDTEPEKSQVSEWSLLGGQREPITESNIANIINKAREYGDSAKKFSLDEMGKFNLIEESNFNKLFDVKNIYDACSTDERPCGPPVLNIFGSEQGAGAAGNLVVNAAGEIIGVDMRSFGVGYDEDTRAVVWDDCGKGKGAKIRPIMGDVFGNFRRPRNNNGQNKGTPEFAPASLGFGPFAIEEYEFSELDDSSIRLQPYSPKNIAYGTPAYGLGPSVAELGKTTDGLQLGVRDDELNESFGIETFTIPHATKNNVRAIFTLTGNITELQNIKTDFDFTNDDISGRGNFRENEKNPDLNQIFYKGKTVGELSDLAKKQREQSDRAYKKSQKIFNELFDEGQRQRVVEGRRYLVRGFQFDGEPLLNPVKVSPDGKCIFLDAVTGRVPIQEPRKRVVHDQPSYRYINFDFGNAREQRRFDANPLGYFADKLRNDNTEIRLLDGGGDDTNATFTITNNGERHDIGYPNKGDKTKVVTKAKFVIGEFQKGKKGLYVEGIGKIWFKLKYDDDPAKRAIAIDRITIHDDEGQKNIWQQTKKGVKKPTDGKPEEDIDYGDDGDFSETGHPEDNNSIRLHPHTRIETYFVEVYTEGESDDRFNDLVVCAKIGRFFTKKNKVYYKFRDKDKDPSPEITTPIPTPPPTTPTPPEAPVLPLGIPIDTTGGGGGGIPGILTPLSKGRSTFHPFPGSTTLGPGKWVVGPIPPGGGGPHIGPAVFVHDNLLVGELTGQQGTPFKSTQRQGKGAEKSGGGGSNQNAKNLTNDVYVFGSRTGGVDKWGQYQDGTFNSDLWNQTLGKTDGIPEYLRARQKSGGAGGGEGDIPFNVKKGFTGTSEIPEYLRARKSYEEGGFTGTNDNEEGGIVTSDEGGIIPTDDEGGFIPTPKPVPTPPPGSFPPGSVVPPPEGPGGIPPNGPTTPITEIPPGPGGWFPNSIPPPLIPDDAIPLPGYPGTMVPPESGGFTGPGIGVVDIDIVTPGFGYLPAPDGSYGGGGRVYSDPDDTRIRYPDGTKELPIPPDNRICLDEGSEIILPPGTRVVTEPFDGEGGGEVIVGGSVHIMQFPGCLTTPEGGEGPPSQNTYPVLMYLCDVFIIAPGSGYKNTDKVIIEPSMGAEAELVVDKFGRISDVLITAPGEGFQVIPSITVESSTGVNAQLRAKLCIDRVGEIVPGDQEKVIQVVDCVGTFPL